MIVPLRRLFFLLLFLCTAGANAGINLLGGAQADNKFLPVDQAFRFSSSIETGAALLHWDITEGYYLYKSRIKVTAQEGDVVLGALEFSHPGVMKDDPNFGPMEVFHQAIEVKVPIKNSAGHTEIHLQVSYQGCAEAGLCYPPQHREALFLADNSAPATSAPDSNATPQPASINNAAVAAKQSQSMAAAASNMGSGNTNAKPQSSSTALDVDSAQSLASFIAKAALWQTLGLFFLLGIGLAFTPCVFPMIPILSSIIAGQKHSTTFGSFLLSLAYVLGVAATYALLGALVGWAGQGVNLQAQLQNPWVLSVFAALFVLFALSMFGFFELQMPAFLRDRLNDAQQKQQGGSLAGVFVMGMLSALVVSPCVSAPLAGVLIYIAGSGQAALGALILFVLALGMGLPLLLVGTGAGKWLPKAGAWMVAVKAVFGVLLLGVAIWLLDRILPGPVTLALWALLLAPSAVFMGAFEPAAMGWQRLWKGLGLLLFAYAILLLIGAAQGANDPLNPLQRFAGSTSVTAPLAFNTIYSAAELQQQLTQAQSQGQPVMVDFYADWCISCKLMERDTFPNPEVQQQLQGFRLLKADVTANSPDNKALLDQFGLYGPPGMVFYDQHGQELTQQRIYGEITTQKFIEHLRNLPR